MPVSVVERCLGKEVSMRNKDVDEKKLKNGEYCQKGVSGCFCKVGWPCERLHPDCRDKEDGQTGNRTSYCICPPKDL